jgi:hypothetical protein
MVLVLQEVPVAALAHLKEDCLLAELPLSQAQLPVATVTEAVMLLA